MALTSMRLEREALRDIAAEYRQQGYDVVIEPEYNQLPDFLKGYRPDAIARGKDETVVIEVKKSPLAEPAKHLKVLAEEISKHPGWRLKIVLAGPGSDALEEELSLPTFAEIGERLASADRMFEVGDHAAALLLLWSLLEAASLHRLRDLGVEPFALKTPIALLKDLVSFGFLEQEEYDRLREVVALRNAVAHGFTTASIDAESFSGVRSLIERLLEASSEPAESVD